MARTLPIPCRMQPCPELVQGGGFCPRHREPRPESKALTITGGRIYDTALWKRIAALVLANEPMCRHCAEAGRDELATEVDHIEQLSMGGHPYSDENLQPLCKPCHSRKTAHEMGFDRESRETG